MPIDLFHMESDFKQSNNRFLNVVIIATLR